MTKIRTMLFTAALAAFLAVPAAAQTSVTLTSGSGVGEYGVYVGPYQLLIGPNGYTIDAVCDDWVHDVSINENWTAHFTNLGGQPDFSLTRAGTSAGSLLIQSDRTNALQLYQEAAWLTLQFETAPIYSWGDIHATIWNLFEWNHVLPSTLALPPVDAALLADAQQNYSSVDPSRINVITPVVGSGDAMSVDWSTSSPQEFIQVTPQDPQVTPEPQVYVLLATGLLLLGLVYLKRRGPVLDA